ncbi:MAG: heat-inducible transcription repressor HrcA [Elusimicrobia bacterium]|nr:heat-inducible transcription repressor HrcA [Elusimicrobiota bacterium]
MRHLDPKIANERKARVLRWVVHNFIKTKRPIASSVIAEESGLGLSSATIRSILAELEDEGFLTQPHTSSGRTPTDRGYRTYVDFLQDVQRLTSNEKARLEAQYKDRLEELDNLLSQTSRLLSTVSHKTGLVLSPKIDRQTLKRLELIALGPKQVLAIVITQNGQVRHLPLRLAVPIAPPRLAALNRLINEHAVGRTIKEVREALSAGLEEAGRDLQDLQTVAGQLLGEVDRAEGPEPLYLEGAATLVDSLDQPGEFGELQSVMRVMEERAALANVLEADLQAALARPDGKPRAVRIRIGGENDLPELKNLSLVTTTYMMKDRAVGVLGILGPKRMEYERMMALVQTLGGLLSRSLAAWEPEDERG